ncbi:MASE1 domain-containing protein [Citromicrobium bathyomarinum]
MSGSASIRAGRASGPLIWGGLLARLPVQILGLALGYALLGWIGQQLAPPPGFASLIWPAAGLSIAAITALGYRVWPGVFLGAWCVNALAAGSGELQADVTVALDATLIATGSTLQALLGAYWIRSRAGFPLKLEGPRELGRLLLLVGPFTCLVGATVGTATLFASGVVAQSNLINFWLRWWGGDMGGVLIVVPLLRHPAGSASACLLGRGWRCARGIPRAAPGAACRARAARASRKSAHRARPAQP